MCRPPSSPGSIFSAALCAIISTAICSTKNFFKPTCPFVAVSFGSSPIEALYDTGSDVSCVDESVFRSIPINFRPPQCTSSPRQTYHSASGNQLVVKGVYPFKISILGRTIEHKFCVIKNLSEKVIIGADFINLHALRYCPLSASTTWATPSTWDKGSARIASVQTLPPFTSKLVPVQLYTASQARPAPGSNLVVNVIAEQFPELSGGPALLQADVFGKSHLEICNLGPHPVTLPRDMPVAVIENADSCVIEEINPNIINSVAESRHSSVARPPISPEKASFITANAVLNVPDELKHKYLS
jgi:hypothetical protein